MRWWALAVIVVNVVTVVVSYVVRDVLSFWWAVSMIVVASHWYSAERRLHTISGSVDRMSSILGMDD